MCVTVCMCQCVRVCVCALHVCWITACFHSKVPNCTCAPQVTYCCASTRSLMKTLVTHSLMHPHRNGDLQLPTRATIWKIPLCSCDICQSVLFHRWRVLERTFVHSCEEWGAFDRETYHLVFNPCSLYLVSCNLTAFFTKGHWLAVMSINQL